MSILELGLNSVLSDARSTAAESCWTSEPSPTHAWLDTEHIPVLGVWKILALHFNSWLCSEDWIGLLYIRLAWCAGGSPKGKPHTPSWAEALTLGLTLDASFKTKNFLAWYSTATQNTRQTILYLFKLPHISHGSYPHQAEQVFLSNI